MTQMAWSKRDAQWFTGSPLNFSSSDAALSPLHLTDSPGDPHAPLLYKSMEELRPLRPMPTACSPPPSHSGPSGSSSRSTCWTRFVCVCSNINLCDCTSYHNYAIWLNTVWANEMRAQKRVVFTRMKGNVLETELSKRKCCQVRHRSRSCQRPGGVGVCIKKKDCA